MAQCCEQQNLLPNGLCRLDRECHAFISKNEEIMPAVQKRFKNKRTSHGDPGFAALVIWCTAMNSYKVCQANLIGVSDFDVDLAWQFIDTLSISSTKACRGIMNRFKGTKSAVGFKREQMRFSVGPCSFRPSARNVVPPTLVEYSDKDREGYRTDEDLVIQDCMHCVFKSPAPIASALLLRPGFIESNKGSYHRRTHGRRVGPQDIISE